MKDSKRVQEREQRIGKFVGDFSIVVQEEQSVNYNILRKMLRELLDSEISKAKEEGAMNVFTKEEWFMLKLAMNDIFNNGNHAYEGISKKIQSELDKLSNKNKCSGK